MPNRNELPLKIVRMTPTGMTIANAVILREKLIKLMTLPEMPDVVFDLSDVTDVDAAGIGAMTAAYTIGLGFGHNLFIYNPPPNMRTLLEELDLSGFFPLIKSESELLSRVRDVSRAPE